MTITHKQAAGRPVFDEGLDAVLAQHATLRALAAAATREQALATDAVMSLADFMAEHEAMEASLFDLPFMSRMPESVKTTSERMHRRCEEFTSGSARPPDRDAAAGRFIDALLAHIAAEEAWLTEESGQRQRRQLSIT